MINDLERFSVERLEYLANLSSDSIVIGDVHEVAALARIALSAKQAEPDYYLVRNDSWGEDGILSAHENHLDASKFQGDHGGEIIPVCTTPPLNYQAIPDGWKLVPVEPTMHMLRESYRVSGVYGQSSYKAMLAAAPAPEEL